MVNADSRCFNLTVQLGRLSANLGPNLGPKHTQKLAVSSVASPDHLLPEAQTSPCFTPPMGLLVHVVSLPQRSSLLATRS